MDRLDELLKLKELLDLGIITENDFNRKKAELIGESASENNNSDSIKEEEIIIGENEKVCATCKFIIDKESEVCKFCDYDFINENNTENNDDRIDKNTNLKKIALVFSGISILILIGTGLFSLIHSDNKAIESINAPIKESSPKKVSPSENYEMDNAPAAGQTIADSTYENSETSQDYTTNMANVTIGNQIWISKNLDVSEFSNGDPIQEAKNANEWKNLVENREPAWCYLFYDSKNKRVGKIYNWYAVFDSRGLAPSGWHIPDIDEWHNLINYLGGKEKAMNKILGEKWTDYLGGNYKKIFNESNFNAIFGGQISYNSNHNGNLKKEEPYFIANNSFWWSSETPNEVQFTGYPEISKFTKTIKILESSDNYFLYDNDNAGEGSGGYVRCVKN